MTDIIESILKNMALLPHLIEDRRVSLAKVLNKIAKIKEKAEIREVEFRHSVLQSSEKLTDKQAENEAWRIYFNDPDSMKAERRLRKLRLQQLLLEAEIERLGHEFEAHKIVAANQNLLEALALEPEPPPAQADPPRAKARRRS